jgi:hypothetical protein
MRGREVDTFLTTDPLFRVVVADYPDLKSSIRDALIRGGNVEAARRDVLGSVAKKYLAKAPDDAVVGFARTTVSVLRSLQSDPEVCHRFLFPGDGPSVRLPDGPRDASYAALLKVVETAHGVLAPTVLTDETASIQVALAKLTEKYGDDVDVLQGATAPGVDRGLVCRMTIAFYEAVLQLPGDDAGRTLRWIFREPQASGAQRP